MASCLIGVILLTYLNIVTNGSPIPPEVTDYYQESLEDIIRRAQRIGALIPESVTVATDDKEDIIKIVKDFIGNEEDVKRTLFFCKDGMCNILNGGDFNTNDNRTDAMLNAQKKKLMKNKSEEKIKEIFKAKENEVLSVEATHEDNKEGDEDGENILSMPKLKFDKMFKGHKYVRVMTNTELSTTSETTPYVPKIGKYKFAKTRVPMTTTMMPQILYEDTKILMPEKLDEVIRQYQMYPGAGCVYVKGCDGAPTEVIKSPKAMALIAKIYREIAQEEDGHKMMTFYLQKYEPDEVHVEEKQYKPLRTSTTTSTEPITECFMY